MKLITALYPETAQREAEEQARQETEEQARRKADRWTAPAWLSSWWAPPDRSPIPSDTVGADPPLLSMLTGGARRRQIQIAIGALLALAGMITLVMFVATNRSPSGSTLAPKSAQSAAPTAGPEVAIPALGATIPVGKTPGFVVVSPNGRHAYIANRAAQLITVLDTAVNKVTATIAIPAGPPQSSPSRQTAARSTSPSTTISGQYT